MENHTTALPIATGDGRFTAHYSEKGLTGLDFPNSKTGLSRRQSAVATIPARIRRWHRTTKSALKKTLAGGKPKNLPPFHPIGTAFQQAVWRELQKIPQGGTKSYGEIARRIGKPTAVRAVGGACGANPIPVLVPCHRVLAANKKLGGFSGGLEWKRTLLAREGVTF